MGNKNKLLLPFEGEVLIRRFVRSVCLSEVGNVFVVLGYESDRIKDVLKGQPVDFVYNPSYSQGMTTSIKAGIRASPEKSDGYMICLSDMPLVKTKDFNILSKSFSFFRDIEENGFIIVPIFKGIRGNPVIFSHEFREEILGHQGEGCRGIIENYPSNVREVLMQNGNLFKDIDTQEDYKKIN